MGEHTISYHWRDAEAGRLPRTAVSLHSHTMHSRESLEFIPRYAKGIPYLQQAVAHQERRFERMHGYALDFDRAWWTPPLSPAAALTVERRQTEDVLGVPALVSLTDHDTIEAGLLLQARGTADSVPISVEWTVPFDPTFFHLGIHNLPAGRARALMADLEAHTAAPSPDRLTELLAALNSDPDILIVFNHPLWDEKQIGQARHDDAVERFLSAYGRHLHAFELNGLRGAAENSRACQWAARHGRPVVSGGDRHACEPNAILNLTHAATFPEFVREIRQQGASHVLFMRQYREPMPLRLLQSLLDVLRDYPDHAPERRRWTDRVHYRGRDGAAHPLSALWPTGGPAIVQQFVWLVRLLESRRVRGALRSALAPHPELAL